MIFQDIPSGASVFVDANVFVYHFMPHPDLGQACTEFAERVERQDVIGFTSTHMLSEVAHRLMTIEASTVFNWPPAGIAQRLRRHPVEVQQLTRFRDAMDQLMRSRVQVHTIAPRLVLRAAEVSRQTGLLSNDALVVAVMQDQGLTDLASHDADFDRVPGITRYGPA